jgi:hypothetical protein
VPEEDPAATVTDAGAVIPLEAEIPTEAPELPAGELNVTVQFAVLPGASTAGLHEIVEICADEAVNAGLTVMVPPLAETGINLAERSTATLLRIDMAVFPEAEESETLTFATVPLPMASVFCPAATQVYLAAPGKQVRVFWAAVSAGPAVMVNCATKFGSIPNVHSKPAGAELPGLNDIPRETAEAAVAVPEARDRVACARAEVTIPQPSRRKMQ